ncbi:hypothetical protein RISK_001801 [Rhodopirellula islandica]|uniref:Uncharacterized protein n=1 Tax=Rhodopirellula islandica TaxID=595434 RepID=A0A0J1BHD9_RHOIS|nr:hypothetical protein RISK_001801 [Rhodopirellula islandica]
MPWIASIADATFLPRLHRQETSPPLATAFHGARASMGSGA